LILPEFSLLGIAIWQVRGQQILDIGILWVIRVNLESWNAIKRFGQDFSLLL
jgi:hypothetical protein